MSEVEGMTERERLIRGGFCFDSDRDCEAAKYLIGVIDVIRQDRKLLRERLDEQEFPEVPCCPVHEKLYRAGQVEPLNNCFICIRNERDFLKAELAEIKKGLLSILAMKSD